MIYRIMEIEESVQPKRVPPNSGGEGGGGTPLDPPILVDVAHLQKLGPYFWKECVWTFWCFEQNQHSRIFNQIIVSVAVDTVTTWSVPDMLMARHSNPTRIHSHPHLAYFVRCNKYQDQMNHPRRPRGGQSHSNFQGVKIYPLGARGVN